MWRPTLDRHREELSEWIKAKLAGGVQLMCANARVQFAERCRAQGFRVTLVLADTGRKQVVELLRLPDVSSRSHRCCRGGATALMENGWPDVRQYGRWASQSSAQECARLDQMALSWLSHRIPEERWKLFEDLAGGCVEAWWA